MVHQRKPSTYAGHPFIVEMAMAYGGDVPKRGNFVIYRFANKIPLLYDEASDVSYRVISAMNWRRYKVSPEMPIAIVIHICSTKVPYKTVGKEFISDRPEVRREEANALREVARQLQHFLARQEHVHNGEETFGHLQQVPAQNRRILNHVSWRNTKARHRKITKECTEVWRRRKLR